MVVDGSATLDGVHDVIQAAFGWWNHHLHEFRIGGRDCGIPDPDWDMSRVLDESRYRLDAVSTEGDRFHHVYDFGDNWDHDILSPGVSHSATPRLAVSRGRLRFDCIRSRRRTEEVGEGTGAVRTVESPTSRGDRRGR